MDLDLSYENGGMHFILYVTHISGNICKMSKYIGSDSTIMQNHINQCFSYVRQYMNEHYPKMLMDLDYPYQN